MEKIHIGIDIPRPKLRQVWDFVQKWLIPNPGTLILMVILALAVPTIAGPSSAPSATSISTIPYQGRLADAGGNPITAKQNMEFRVYDAPVGGTPLWEEFWTGGNSVNVSDGLFSVMLGSINTGLASVVQGYDELYLGITIGTDSEMEPRVQLGSVPFSMISLTVTDGSVTTAKIADNAVTAAKIVDGAVGSSEVVDNSLTDDDLAANSVGSSEVADNSLTNDDLAANSVGSSEITNGAVTQVKAPSLLQGPGANYILKTGSYVVVGDNSTEFNIPLGYTFPNQHATFFAVVEGTNQPVGVYVQVSKVAGNNTGYVRMSVPVSGHIGFRWIAIGN
ncbi:MAG: hypothetical protein GY832_05240 [Chloroflexi bacterium]|nr:hypothetical protein [Chloroflexota bacterium]